MMIKHLFSKQGLQMWEIFVQHICIGESVHWIRSSVKHEISGAKYFYVSNQKYSQILGHSYF
jgi:hypothetical protein